MYTVQDHSSVSTITPPDGSLAFKARTSQVPASITSLLEHLLCRLVKEFYSGNQNSNLAEPQVAGTGSSNCAGSIGIMK